MSPAAPVGDRPVDLEVRAEVADADAGRLRRWADGLEATVRHARRTGRLGRVTVSVTGAKDLRGFEAVPGGIDEWVEAPGGAAAPADLVLLLAATIDLAPSALGALLAALDDPDVGMVEPRRIPFQSLKPLDPDSGAVSWVATDCCLVRGEVLDATGGPDTATFPGPGAAIDLAWRARLAGWSVRCAPEAAGYDHSPLPLGEAVVEPGTGAAADKLRLAARYAGPAVARAWATAWLIRGHAEEKDAAAQLERGPAADLLPPRLGGDTDAFAAELFAVHQITAADPGSDAMPAAAVRPRVDPGDPADPPNGTDGGSPPFLSVVVRTQGTRMAELQDNLLSLAAQDCTDFEVLILAHEVGASRLAEMRALVAAFPPAFARRVRPVEVHGGGRARPLNAGLDEAAGRYVAFLDDDDVALANWVSEFRRVTSARPGAIAWSQVAWQICIQTTCAGRPMWRVTEPPQLFVRTFDLLAHLRQNGTPNCAIAVPTALVREHGLRFREDVAVFEDWDMLLRLVQLAPVAETGSVTSLYRRGSADGSGEVHAPEAWSTSGLDILAGLDRTGFVLRPEYLPGLRQALDELDERRGDDGEDPSMARAWEAGPDVQRLAADHFADRRVAVVSPHLDDAVLSCGELLAGTAGAVVITVFAGDDTDWQELTAWDDVCGFSAGTNVMAERYGEDDRALAGLGATGVRLAFLDEQYRKPSVWPSPERIGAALLSRIRASGAVAVLMPLGLGHGDHRLTAEGARWAARHSPELEWFAYQDLPYAYEGADIGQALDELDDMRPEAVRFPPATDPRRKAAAIDRYASQLRGLGDERRQLALRPERYWVLSVPLTRP